jgi:ABC-type sugar transport system substrate-binding protein
MKRVVGLLVILLLGLSLAQDKFKIGALIKNESNPFFITMHDGFDFAAERYGVEIVVGSPQADTATDEQLGILEGWLNEGDFDAFIVVPLRATSLNSALGEASAKGIPIINMDDLIPADSLAESNITLAAKIASNNVRAGSLAADKFIATLEPGAEVLVIEGAAGNTSSIDRVKGFTDAATAGGLNVVASQPADWDRAKAFDVASNLLQANPNVKGIFAANDGMGLGVVEAVAAAGLEGQIIVASVDAIPEAIDAVKAGKLLGTVAQYPDEMAILAVEAMLKVLKGRPIAPELESPVVLITQENAATAGSRLGEAKIAPMKLAGLTKNLSNPFFQTMQDGYTMAAKDLGVEVVLGAPLTDTAEAEQLGLLETWLNEGDFQGLSVTPLRPTTLASGLAAASEQGIPIINIDDIIPADVISDSNLNVAVKIASNNVRAGSLAAQKMLETLEAGTEVAVIEGAAGNTSSIDRVSGFTNTATEGGLNVVVSQPADWDRAKAFDVASNILTSNPNVKAIFAANDGMGLGAVEAVAAAGLEGQVVVYSVDAIPEALDAVREGRLGGTVAQYPAEMAYLAVEMLIKVVEGRPVAPVMESPVALITQENIGE